MTDSVMLHTEDHKDVRIITRRGAAYGDAVQFCLTFPQEFRDVAASYPILFRATSGGGYEALALFGLEPGENLYLGADGSGWDAPYVPLAMRRQPFVIGLHGDQAEPRIHIDLAHPRVSRTEGEALFLKYGGTGEYMDEVQSVLSALHEGLHGSAPFMAGLAELGLLVPLTIGIEAAGVRHELNEFHGIDEQRLGALPGDVLEQLNRTGTLAAIYLALASLSHLRGLTARKERRHAGRA